MSIISRDVTISGQDGYVPFEAQEKKGYYLELWFTDLTTQKFQYENRKHFPVRKYFGKFAVGAEDYVISEGELAYNNQLFYTEWATARYLQHHASCMQIEKQHLHMDALVSSRFVTDTILPSSPDEDTAAAALYVVLRANVQKMLEGRSGSLTSQITQDDYKIYEPRPTPGLASTGFFYSFENFASGKVTIRTYQFDDTCFFPNTGIDSNPNNRASPPATAGGADVPGGAGNVPPRTGNSPPPESGGPRAPTLEDQNPAGPPIKPGPELPAGGTPGTTYRVVVTWTQNGQPNTQTFIRVAPISGVLNTPPDNQNQRIWYFRSADQSAASVSNNRFAADNDPDPFPIRKVTGAALRLEKYP